MWPEQQKTAALVTFAQEILNEKFHFFYSVFYKVADLQVFVYNSKFFKKILADM